MALVFALIILSGIAVWRFGTDSRDGRDWASTIDPSPRNPVAPCC